MPPKSAKPSSKKQNASKGAPTGVKKPPPKTPVKSNSAAGGSLFSSILSRAPWSGGKPALGEESPKKQTETTKESRAQGNAASNPPSAAAAAPRNNPQSAFANYLTAAERTRLSTARLDAKFDRQRAARNHEIIAEKTPTLIFDMAVKKSSKEFQKQRRKLRDRLNNESVLEVLDAEFTPAQRQLLTPQIHEGAITELQRKNTVAYRTALTTAFKGEKDNIATKFAMAKFGLPVEPITNSNLRKLALLMPGTDSDDDDPDDTNEESQFRRITYSEKPLEFLEGYDERSFGFPGIRPTKSTLGLRGGAGSPSDLSDHDPFAEEGLMTLYTYNGVYRYLDDINADNLILLVMDLLNLRATCSLTIDLIEFNEEDSIFRIVKSESFPYVHGAYSLKLQLFDEAHVDDTLTYLTQSYSNQSGFARAFFIRRNTTEEPQSLTPPDENPEDIVVLGHENARSYWKIASNFRGGVGINQVQSNFERAISRLGGRGGDFWLENFNLGYENHEASLDLWESTIKAVEKSDRFLNYTLSIKIPPGLKGKSLLKPCGIRFIGQSTAKDPLQSIRTKFAFWDFGDFRGAYNNIVNAVESTTGPGGRSKKSVKIWSSPRSRELDDGSHLVISLDLSDAIEAIRQLTTWATTSLDPQKDMQDIPIWEFRLEFTEFTIHDFKNKRHSTVWKPGQQPTVSSFRRSLSGLFRDFDTKSSFRIHFKNDKNIFVCPSQMDEREWRMFTFDWFESNELTVEANTGDEYTYPPTCWGLDYDDLKHYPYKDFSLPRPTQGLETLFGGNKAKADAFRMQAAADTEADQTAKEAADAEAMARQKEKIERQQRKDKAKADFDAVLAAESAPRDPRQASKNAAELRRILTSGTREEKAKWYAQKAEADKIAAAARLAEEESDSEPIDHSVPKFRVPKRKYIRAQAQAPAPTSYVDWQRQDTWRNSLRQGTYTKDLSIVEYGLDSVAAQFGDIREASIFASHSLPTVYHQHWSQTEVRKLTEENQALKNASLSRTYICPICTADFSGFDERKKILHFQEHYLQCLNGGKCPLCDSERFATFSLQERKDHLLGHQTDFKRRVDLAERHHLDCPVCHINISYDEFPGAAGVVEHLGQHIPDLYKFCDRCGTSLHELSKAAEDHHEKNCTFESFPEDREQPEELWNNEGIDRFCKWCGIALPPHQSAEYLEKHSQTCGFDRSTGIDRFCSKCGLSIINHNTDAKYNHREGCKQPGGFHGKFCRICGVKTQDLREDAQLSLEHHANCRYQRPFWLLGQEFTNRRLNLKYKERSLSEKEARLEDQEQKVASGLKLCPFCQDQLPESAADQQEHLNLHHLSGPTVPNPYRLYKKCPVCQETLRLVRSEQDAHFKAHRLGTGTTGTNATASSLQSCPLCKESLKASPSAQKAHFEAHALLKHCPVCNVALGISPHARKAHFATHANTQSLLKQCPICDVALGAGSNAQKAHFNTHASVQIRCPWCREGLPDSSKAQEDHLRTRHSSQQPLDCLICENKAVDANCVREHFKQHMIKARELVVISSDVNPLLHQVGSVIDDEISKRTIGRSFAGLRNENAARQTVLAMQTTASQPHSSPQSTSTKTHGQTPAVSYDQLLAHLDRERPQRARVFSRSPAKSQRSRQPTKSESSEEDEDEQDTFRIHSPAKKPHFTTPIPDMSFQPSVEDDSEVEVTRISPRKRGRPRAMYPPTTTPVRRSTRSVSATPSLTLMPAKRTASSKVVEEVQEEDEDRIDTSGSVDEQAPPPKRARRSPTKKYTK